MISHIVNLTIPDAKADGFYNCMINPTDEWYRKWLPDEHWAFHIVKRGRKDHLGDIIFYDEILGSKKHRLTFYAKIVTADIPNKIVWKMRKLGLNLPGYLDIEFTDTASGLALRHEVRIGWRGFGRIIDPILRLFFNKEFFKAIEGHCGREWQCLADILYGQAVR